MRFYQFPFNMVNKGEKIILWGNGNVGKLYVKQLSEIEYCEIIGIVDRNTAIGNNIHPIEWLESQKDKVDKVVICLVDDEQRKLCRNKLNGFGYRTEQIVDCINEIILSNIPKRKIYIKDGIFEFSKQFHKKLNIYYPENSSLIRVGNSNDGGYLMEKSISGDEIVYSFGIGKDVGWELDMAKRGCEVYMYDFTIENLPQQDDKFHFAPKGISGVKHENDTLKTLYSFMKENGHDNFNSKFILKLDVEGAERDTFIECENKEIFDHFQQIIIEIHDILDVNHQSEILEMLDILNITHVPVHIHGNNASSYIWVNDKLLPNTLEVTYLRRKSYSFEKRNLIYPLDLDAPNVLDEEDIQTGRWND